MHDASVHLASDPAATCVGSLHTTTAHGTATVVVRGRLDDHLGEELAGVVGATVAGGVDRLDLDLRDVTSFTHGGAAALLACRDLCGPVPEGLHYRSGHGPGRDALLHAYRNG